MPIKSGKKIASPSKTELFNKGNSKDKKMSLPSTKKNKDTVNDDISREAKSIMEKILGNVSKRTATQQILIGASSGWVTGFLASKIGKAAAFALGGGIIILQVAAHQGYINVNWDKIQSKAEKISDKVEEKLTGEGPNMMDKVGKFWRRNAMLSSCFMGGFLLGLASS